MKTAKLRIVSQVAGVTALVLGVSAIPASAEQKRLLVTLQDGRQLTVTVDVAPGTPLESIPLGDLGSPVVSVVEAPGTPTSGATTPATTTPTTPATTSTSTTPAQTLTTPTTISTTPTTPTTTTPSTTSTTTTPSRTTPDKPANGSLVAPTGNGKHRGKGKHANGNDAVAVDSTPNTSADGGKGAVTDENPQSSTTPDRSAQRDGNNAQNSGEAVTPSAPGFTDVPGLTPTSTVPSFFIDQFSIPPFLLPIYQAAGTQYGVPWQVLAAINEIETNYGRNLSVSSAGAVGWMQFMPSTWKQYGVDANGDGVRDPYNPVDAIFAAARYLAAAGAGTNLNQAIFSYNHADWYVQSVLLRARLIGGMPADLIGSLTGLTQGDFPVAARATYADSLDVRAATSRAPTTGNAAIDVAGDPNRHSINVYAKSGAPVVAVNDGRVVRIGTSRRLGNYVILQDVYGNRYSYDHLGTLATRYPVPKPATTADAARAAAQAALTLPANDRRPTAPATAGSQPRPRTTAGDARGGNGKGKTDARSGKQSGSKGAATSTQPATTQTAVVAKERLFAHPARPLAYAAGGERQIEATGQQVTTFKGYFTDPVSNLNPDDYVLKPLRAGSTVVAGTVLGHVGKTDPTLAPHVEFTIRPAGRGAPEIDPKPILDGWKLLESTSVYGNAHSKDARASLFNPSSDATPGQVLLMSKAQLQQRVLNDPSLDIYACGRQDIATGQIDRRVLATMEFLTASGLRLEISALKCGHTLMTESGNVSEHSTGDAMDIAAVNGIPITGHQGPGTITDITIRRLLTLQGIMKPHQIISLMSYPGTDNTLVLPSHYNHIHVGFRPLDDANVGTQVQQILKPAQWTQLINQIRSIPNPTVPTSPSRYALRDQTKDGSGD